MDRKHEFSLARDSELSQRPAQARVLGRVTLHADSDTDCALVAKGMSVLVSVSVLVSSFLGLILVGHLLPLTKRVL